MNRVALKGIFIVIILFSVSLLIGCVGMEPAPKYGILYYPKELPEADRAVEEARQAGKDRECPDAFSAVVCMKDRAYEIYLACRDKEAIEMAREATDRAKALCPKKPVAKPVVKPPVADFSSTPISGNKPLRVWFTDESTGNIDSWSWDFGDGGTSNVRNPSHTYSTIGTFNITLTVTGPGGSDSETKVSYIQVSKPPTLKVIDRMTLTANFDFDKSDIREADVVGLERAANFVKKYPGAKIRIEGHTDSIGSEKYNQGLSERRAEMIKRYLVQQGCTDETRISTIGYGESRPVASNKTEEGMAKNRRVEILILSE